MSKKAKIGFIIVFLIVIVLLLKIMPPLGPGRMPEGYIEQGTSYAEAKPRVLSLYPDAQTNDKKTGVSYGAISVKANDYEGVNGQSVKITYIFDPASQKLDMLSFYIDDPKSNYKKLQKKWKNNLSGQYGKPEIDCSMIAPSGNEILVTVWERGLTEVRVSTYTDTGVIVSFISRSNAKYDAETMEEMRQYQKYDWIANLFAKWSAK